MRIGLAAGVLILTCPSLGADVDVRMSGQRVSLRAVSAPVAEVLERLARTTGMRVVYDGPVPRQPLTATLEGREPAEAVLAVLEGFGLNYVLVMDPSGTRVDQLLILGAAAATPGSARSAPTAAPPSRRNMPQETNDDMEAVQAEVEAQQGQDDVAEEEVDETNAQPSPAPPPEPVQLRAPEYPSSSFTPKIPMPSATPVPQATPPPPSRS